MELLLQYFPNLTPHQLSQFEQLEPLYREWNEKINVISRKDMDDFYIHHVLHSLAIAKFMPFKAGSKVLDLGTGGGFPGIPLAIMFPDVQFVLVDSIGKKIMVVNEVAASIGLINITTHHKRVEEIKDKFDFVVTRAVASFENLINWTQNKIATRHLNQLPHGIIALKGGDIKKEIRESKRKVYSEIVTIPTFFKEDFFETKSVVYVQG
jgi:16S rRNA (guanine527-N7)-methyltransferase